MTLRALAGLVEEQIKIPAPILGDSQALVTPAPGNLKSFSTIKNMNGKSQRKRCFKSGW